MTEPSKSYQRRRGKGAVERLQERRARKEALEKMRQEQQQMEDLAESIAEEGLSSSVIEEHPGQPEIEIPYMYQPRPYQRPLWDFLESGGKRAVCIWHRRGGKDLLSINWCALAMFRRPGLYWHCFPTYNQGRKIIWDGFTKAGKRFLDAFPKELVAHRNNNDMRIELVNGSIYQVVGTDNPDRLVGPNPFGIVFSEYSISDPRAWTLTRPILRENGGWAVFIYTPRGRNHGWELLDRAKKRPKWFWQILTVHDTERAVMKEAEVKVEQVMRDVGLPVPARELQKEEILKAAREQVPMTEADIQEEREDGMPEEMIQQEFYTSFDAPLIGAYYGSQMAAALAQNRIGKFPWEPKLPVHTVWDLGVGDENSIWFWQEIGPEVRIIDFYTKSGEGLPHYAKILKEKPYALEKHFAPHDIEVREYGSGKTRLETARDLGIRFRVLPKAGLLDGIEAVRNLLPKCYFNEATCSHGIRALCEYSKEWDDLNKCFSAKPEHNWTSHPADAFRYLAMAYKGGNGRKEKRQQSAVDNHNYLGVR